MTAKERDAWTFAYRLYDEFSPKLRAAAAIDDQNETAGQVFLAALEKIKPHFTSGDDDHNWILLGVYDILDYVFKAAQKRAVEKPEKITA